MRRAELEDILNVFIDFGILPEKKFRYIDGKKGYIVTLRKGSKVWEIVSRGGNIRRPRKIQ